jgi:cytoskeletal protein CcmA (bactofilin family)
MRHSIYMFGSNPKTGATTPTPAGTQPSAYGSAPNRVSSGVSIKGEVKFGSELVIDGEIEGNIISTGKLIVGAHAMVVGDIQAGFVTIQGSVEGNVLATERCALEAGASLQGDVEAPRLAVDENASFTGSATITKRPS